MDGLGQLYVAKNGSIYALVPAAEPEPPRRCLAPDNEVTQALLAQFLQRQQHQEQQHRHPDISLQLDGLAVPGLAHQREDALHNLLQATIVPSFQGLDTMNPAVGPSMSSHMGASAQLPFSRGRAASGESPSNSESQSPPPSARGGDRSDRSNQNGLAISGQLSAKEKNRQAQRRFRERQKDLIANLKQRVEDLQAKVAESAKEIMALKEENAMLRGRVEAKQQASSVTLPAEALHSLLQMTGAGSLLAEMAAGAAANRAGSSGAGGGVGGGGGGSGPGGSRGGRGRGGGGGAAAAAAAAAAARGGDVARRMDLSGGRNSDLEEA